ncbi:hypothetical protein ACTFIZ_006316 [Dictyostelium cf. discoideum]
MEYEKFINENQEILIGIDQNEIFKVLKGFTPNQLEVTNIKNLVLELLVSKLVIEKKDTEIAKQNTEIAKQNTEIAKQNTEIAKQNTEIAKQNTENKNLKQTIVDLTLKNKNESIKSPATHAELFNSRCEDKMVIKDCDFKSWGIPNTFDKVNKKIRIEKSNKTEKDIQMELDNFFKSFKKNRRIFIENGTSIKIRGFSSNNYCDYIIKEIGFPNAPFWIHMIGEVKKDSITSDGVYGQIFKYIDNIVEKSNHYFKKRPMFGFLINTEEINFTKYETSEGKYYITKNYPINEGIQLLSNLMFFLEAFITEIPLSLNKCLSGDVEFFYGATSNVFIVNDNLVFKWFNDSIDYKNEVTYLGHLKGIDGTPSIVEKNESEKWIKISPRGHLVKNLKDKVLSISFYTKCVEILEKIHQRYIIHRDVRSSNLLKMDNGSPLLVDFGFATNTRNDVIYCGTMSTASNRIYKILIDNGLNHTFSVTEADDLESLVKVFVMENEDSTRMIVNSTKNKEVGRLMTIWDWIRTNNNYSKLFQHASNRNYEELKKEFLVVDQKMKSTIQINDKENIDFNINKGSNNTLTTSKSETINDQTICDHYYINMKSNFSFVRANLIEKPEKSKRLERVIYIFHVETKHGKKEISMDLVQIEKEGILFMDQSLLIT